MEYIPFVLFVVLPYFAPAVIALLRNHRQRTAIFVLNLFGGWTGFGWLIALVWSFMN